MLEAASSLSVNKIVSQAARNIIQLKQQWREEEGTCSCNRRALSRFSHHDFPKEKRKVKKWPKTEEIKINCCITIHFIWKSGLQSLRVNSLKTAKQTMKMDYNFFIPFITIFYSTKSRNANAQRRVTFGFSFYKT